MNLVRIEFVKKQRFQNELNEMNQNIHQQIFFFFFKCHTEIQSSDDSCRENCSQGKLQACDPAVFMDQHGQLRQWDVTILRNTEHSRDIHTQIYKLSLRRVKDEEKQLKDLPSLKAVLQKVKQRFLHHICNLLHAKIEHQVFLNSRSCLSLNFCTLYFQNIHKANTDLNALN